MKPENAIEIDDVWKSYRTGAIRGQTLLRQIESGLALLRGKEDPNSKILQREELTSESTSKNQKFWALRSVSFQVKQGEVVALLGRNGAGKSTLLQILSRITGADKGRIRVRGKVASLLGAGVGFNDEMTGRENVYLNGSILGMTPAQIEEKMAAIADFAEIPQFMDTPVKRFSSGMKSRLGFSVAVHLDCDIMILDEVFATGDRLFRLKCIDKMRELALSGRTILIVTHLPDMLMGFCRRGIFLKEGELQFDGEIAAAIDLYWERSHENAPDKIGEERKKLLVERIDLYDFQIRTCDEQKTNSIDLTKQFTLHVKAISRVSSKKGEIVVILSSKRTGVISRISSYKSKNAWIDLEKLCGFSIGIEKMNINSVLEEIHISFRILDHENERRLIGEKNIRVDVDKGNDSNFPGFIQIEDVWSIDCF